MVEEQERRELSVTVHDEDDGTVEHVIGTPEELVGTVVDRFYKDHLHRDRRDGDRLRCEANGDDVFSRLDERLEHYAKTECRALVWLFVGDQGGAAA